MLARSLNDHNCNCAPTTRLGIGQRSPCACVPCNKIFQSCREKTRGGGPYRKVHCCSSGLSRKMPQPGICWEVRQQWELTGGGPGEDPPALFALRYGSLRSGPSQRLPHRRAWSTFSSQRHGPLGLLLNHGPESIHPPSGTTPCAHLLGGHSSSKCGVAGEKQGRWVGSEEVSSKTSRSQPKSVIYRLFLKINVNL